MKTGENDYVESQKETERKKETCNKEIEKEIREKQQKKNQEGKTVEMTKENGEAQRKNERVADGKGKCKRDEKSKRRIRERGQR